MWNHIQHHAMLHISFKSNACISAHDLLIGPFASDSLNPDNLGGPIFAHTKNGKYISIFFQISKIICQGSHPPGPGGWLPSGSPGHKNFPSRLIPGWSHSLRSEIFSVYAQRCERHEEHPSGSHEGRRDGMLHTNRRVRVLSNAGAELFVSDGQGAQEGMNDFNYNIQVLLFN